MNERTNEGQAGAKKTVNFIVNTHTGLHILNKLVIVLFHYNVSLKLFITILILILILQTYTYKNKI